MHRRTLLSALPLLPFLGAAKNQPKPNIVLIIADDQPMDAFLNAMPKTLATPNLSIYSKAYCNAVECDPSRASIYSGLYDVHHGVLDNTLDTQWDQTKSIAPVLQAAGYFTGFYGKYMNHWELLEGRAHQPPGWNEWHDYRGLSQFYKFTMNNNGRFHRYVGLYEPDFIAADGAAFIKSHASSPFFLVLATHAPHQPDQAAQRYVGAFEDAVFPPVPSFNVIPKNAPAWVSALPSLDPKKMHNIRRSVWKASLAIDDLVQTTLGALTQAGVLDNTLVVFCSDQGIAMGEHRWTVKRDPYQPTVNCPFFIRWPGGTVDPSIKTRLINYLDIAPTILSLAGATASWPLDGVVIGTSRNDTLMHWTGGGVGGGDGPDLFVPGWWAITDGATKYIELDTGEKEFYDLVADPDELDNVAATDLRVAGAAARLAAAKPV